MATRDDLLKFIKDNAGSKPKEVLDKIEEAKKKQSNSSSSSSTTSSKKTTTSNTNQPSGRVAKGNTKGEVTESKPKVVSKPAVIVSEAKETMASVKEQTKDIDDNAQYQLESGEVVSGTKLKTMIAVSGAKHIQSTVRNVPSGKYVKKDGEYYKVDPSTEYLLKHAEPEESQELYDVIGEKTKEVPDDFVGPVKPSAGELATQEAYKSLSKGEKAEYGQKFVDWESIPLPERKYYEGFSKIRDEMSNKDAYAEVEAYLKQHPTETYPSEQYIPAMSIGKYGSKLTGPVMLSWKDVQRLQGFPGFSKEQFLKSAATDIYYTPQEQTVEYKKAAKKFASKSPLHAGVQAFADFGHSGGMVLASPVLIGEQIASYASKGKTPTIASDFFTREAIKTGKPPGGFEGVISEGIGFATGKESDAFERMQDQPVRAIASTAGEIAGSWMLGQASKPVKGAVTTRVVKPTIRSMPKVATKFKTTFGFDIPGYRIASQSKIGQTAFKWSAGYQKGSQYALKSTNYFDDAASGVTSKVDDVYKNVWGKSEKFVRTRQKTWLSPDEVARFKQSLKPDTTFTSRIIRTGQSARMKVNLVGEQFKLKGRSLVKTQGSIEMEKIFKNPFRTSTKLGPTTKGSFYNIKPSGYVDDFIQPKPSVLKSMLQKGYTVKKPTGFTIKDSAMAKFYGSVDDWVKGPSTYSDDFVKGFGDTNLIQSPRFYGGHFKPVKTKFLKSLTSSKEALQTVIPKIKIRSDVLRPTSWKSAGKAVWKRSQSFGDDFIKVPLPASGLLPASASLLGSGSALGYRSELMSKQLMKQEYIQVQQPVEISIRQPKMEYQMKQASALDMGMVSVSKSTYKEVPIRQEEMMKPAWVPPVKAMGKPKPFYFDFPSSGSKKKRRSVPMGIPSDLGALKREFKIKDIWGM